MPPHRASRRSCPRGRFAAVEIASIWPDSALEARSAGLAHPIHITPGETKNGKGRQFPFAPIPRLKEAIEAQYAQKLETERRTGSVVRAVFFYQTGKPISDFRGAWDAACARAGHPDIIFHDMRRTAARNLIRAGVPQRVAMELTGHLTASIFQRYAIVDETMLTEAAAKLASHLKGDVKPERKVIPVRRAP